MKRRTLLQWLAGATGALRFAPLRVWAQTASFPGSQAATLRALAALVLPTELSREGTDRVAGMFEQWVRDYRPGADMEHGYGAPRLRSKPPSPAGAYLAQLETLRHSLETSDAAARRSAIEAALTQANIQELPESPNGGHIISDLMSFYFRSSAANDLCYRAAIGREGCNGLKGTENPPPPLKGTA